VNKKSETSINKNCISYDEGLKMAEKIGAYNYFEYSALTKQGLDDIFEFAVKVVNEKKFLKKVKGISKNEIYLKTNLKNVQKFLDLKIIIKHNKRNWF